MNYILDAVYCQDLKETYGYWIDLFDLPDYTGHNLDALWDAMTDRSHSLIEVKHARLFYEHLAERGLAFLDLLGDLDREGYHQVIIKW